MSTAVRIVLAASGRPQVAGLPAHRKVSIAGQAGTVTFDVMDPEVNLDGLADEWSETPRPGGRPLLERVGPRLRKMELRSVFGLARNVGADGQGLPVHDPILTLTALASPTSADAGTVRLAYSDLESHGKIARGGGWVITDLSVKTRRRRQGDNAVSRAEVSLTLTESSRATIPGPPSAVPTAAAAGAKPVGPPSPTSSPTPPPAQQRRYTIRQGDTLWKIAAAMYGDGNRWSAIAKANSIRDPRRLTVGAVLTIP